MGESEAGPSRARRVLRGLVAWSYLLSGLLVLPLSADVLLHELGLISGMSFVWDTAGVPPGSYFISADVSDNLVTTNWHTEIPVQID